MPSTVPLPANPWIAWAIVALSIVIAVAPIISSHMKDHGGGSHITVSPAAPPPQIDAGNALIATLVEKLETRAVTAEKKVDELTEEIADLHHQLARAEERNEHLNTRVQILTDRLIQRGQRDN